MGCLKRRKGKGPSAVGFPGQGHCSRPPLPASRGSRLPQNELKGRGLAVPFPWNALGTPSGCSGEEGERERNTQRDRERQKKRQRKRHRDTERETEKERKRQIKRKTERKREKNRKTYRQTYRNKDRHTDRHTERQMDRQTETEKAKKTRALRVALLAFDAMK